MSKYLQPPQIQIGLYWIGEPENYSFQRVLEWLLSKGYSPPYEALVLDTSVGEFPNFTMISDIGARSRQIKSISELQESMRLETDWVPVDLYLAPNKKENVEITLSYGPIYAEDMPANDHHPIRITASAADLNVLENSNEAHLSAKVVARAHRTEKWERNTFRNIVSELTPDLAGSFLEWSLQPPSSIIESSNLSDFNGLYVSDIILPSQKLADVLSSVEFWTCVRIGSGIVLRCSKWGSKEAALGMKKIRDALKMAIANA